jgi:uncharacterized protein (DUF433 family)
MEWRERNICGPKILMGKPSVKGTRISVELRWPIHPQRV